MSYQKPFLQVISETEDCRVLTCDEEAGLFSNSSRTVTLKVQTLVDLPSIIYTFKQK